MDILPKSFPAHSLLLSTAARRADGRVIPPETLCGGARANAVTPPPGTKSQAQSSPRLRGANKTSSARGAY